MTSTLPRYGNNSGNVHGGALAAFADDLGGTLAGLNVPPGFRTTTIESKTNIVRACGLGHLTGIAVRSMWDDRPANLDTPPRRKAGRTDDPDSDRAPKRIGDAYG